MASEYHRGEMDISEQAATYHAVMGMTKWGSLAIGVALLTLTLCLSLTLCLTLKLSLCLTLILVRAVVIQQSERRGRTQSDNRHY